MSHSPHNQDMQALEENRRRENIKIAGGTKEQYPMVWVKSEKEYIKGGKRVKCDFCHTNRKYYIREVYDNGKWVKVTYDWKTCKFHFPTWVKDTEGIPKRGTATYDSETDSWIYSIEEKSCQTENVSIEHER